MNNNDLFGFDLMDITDRIIKNVFEMGLFFIIARSFYNEETVILDTTVILIKAT